MFRFVHRGFCALVLGFLILPILVIVPLSFNAQPYFTFTADMIALRPEGYSLRWYLDVLENGMADPAQPKWTAAYLSDVWTHGQWVQAARNSVFIGLCATAVATVLGTLAALGLGRLVASLLYGISERDPVVLAASALVLCLVGVAASLVPAWRAARVDPVTALRAD